MTQLIRVFIAIELPPDVKREMERVRALLAQSLPEQAVRWVQPDKMHLTLCFLGDTAVSQLPLISQRLDECAAQYAPFTLLLDGLGCFPNRQRPRVIWVGLKGEQVERLQVAVETAVAQPGTPKDNKPFRAHLTCGRVKEGYKLANTHWQVVVKPVAMTVSAIHLIESQLRPSGPIYTVRHTSRLRVAER